MRVAVLADIHANAPALRAVLAQLDSEQPDALLVAGDVVGGPLVSESLDLLSVRPEAAHWLRGNSEREAVPVHNRSPASDDAAGRAASWSARGHSTRAGVIGSLRGRSRFLSTVCGSATARHFAMTRS